MWRDKGIAGTALPLYLATALLGFARAPASAQAIRGVVVDDVSLTTAPSALVRPVLNEEAGRAVLTDDDGGFFLSLPEAGEYRLEVSGMGYETALSQVVCVERGDTLSVGFLMRNHRTRPILPGSPTSSLRRSSWEFRVFLTPETRRG